MTLPSRTLERLRLINPDRARAIVQATENSLPEPPDASELPKLVEAAPGVSIIVVGPSRCLSEIKWLRLIEVAPLRYLLMIPTGTPIDSLELALIDLLENSARDDVRERTLLESLRQLMSTLRRRSKISKAELLVVEKTLTAPTA